MNSDDALKIVLKTLGIANLSVLLVWIISALTAFFCCRNTEVMIVQLSKLTTLQTQTSTSSCFIKLWKWLSSPLYVKNTIVVDKWYIQSISQYSGVRGASAALVFSFTTACVGFFQITLSFLLFLESFISFEESNLTMEIVRLAILIIGGLGCITISIFPYNIPWKYGRKIQIENEWTSLTSEEKSWTIRSSIQLFRSLLSSSSSSSSSLQSTIVVDGEEWIFHPQWNRFHIGTNLTGVELVNFGAVGLMKKQTAEQVLTNLLALMASSSSRAKSMNYACLPPESYILARTFEKGGDQLKELNNSQEEIVIENDDTHKKNIGTIHLVVATMVVFFNAIAWSLPHNGDMNSGKESAKILGIVGFVFFSLFSLLQLISGNMNDRFPDCLTKRIRTCSESMGIYCVQEDPEHYPCSKTVLSIIINFTEMLGIGCSLLAISFVALW